MTTTSRSSVHLDHRVTEAVADRGAEPAADQAVEPVADQGAEPAARAIQAGQTALEIQGS